jgi:hypothetical protein
MAKLDLPRTITFHLDPIRDDIYLGRVIFSNELGKHRPDEGLHPTARDAAIDIDQHKRNGQL